MDTISYLSTEFLRLSLNPFNFDYATTLAFMEAFKWVAMGISIGYVMAVFTTQAIMHNFKPFQLTTALNLWNLWLALFSLIGSAIVGVQLFADVFNYGFDATINELTPVWRGLSGYMLWIFAVSKIAEFGDTFLIVLKKKPLIFLHWYHHVMTMNYAIFAYTSNQGYNSWISFLNLSVHAIMYSYYLLKSRGVRVPAWVAQSITSSQILQFILTLAIQVRIVQLYQRGDFPDLDHIQFSWCLLMEISYVILFGHFFYQAYVKGGGAKYNLERKAEKRE